MRKPKLGWPPLPEGWENLPDEYEIDYDGYTYSCLLNGKQHSWNDLPARVNDRWKVWYLTGRIHRVGKPAIINPKSKYVGYWLNDLSYEPDPLDLTIENIKDIL